ncbi:MAG: putative acetyltransferase [Firmicutes bacterium ADurb.Bin080]|nr:MAG: putative acetyltransferase [Firmicutes bacterium ADurb.Bin080]
MVNYEIREIKSSEIYLLKDFLYEAIFQRDEENLLPKDIINKPELRVFIDGFGKPDDCCLVADINGKVVGAVWTRILSGEVKGFGNVDEYTPVFAISLYKKYRNMGVGTALMRRMLELLKERGYKKASLAVQKDNYAVSMYEKVGFKIVKELEEEYLMICELN